ncbi:Bifunctional protein GlmU [Cupriavidus laharis]|uniref:Bifunctional protein GlmU n=1 Tax=Cupriavidus laharis TaxID=151654 RepID=A0ABN7Y7M3_9BURK|nr:nucleotidyltransferase family protein [Cupriavidus laharis]CAG9168436.1 Bifunctional protein GlmU [Cupriavidus laharis]
MSGHDATAATAAPPVFSAVLLAAGLSARMGGPHKLLMEIGGQPVVRRTAIALLDAGPAEVVVVTGHHREAVQAALHGLPLRFWFNPRYADGQMTSVAAGVASLAQPCDVVLVCLADQVLLTAADYLEIVHAFAGRPHGSIVVPWHAGQRGNPVAFAAWHAPQVIGGQVNPGCRHLIADHPDEVFVHQAAHARFTTDLDTPEDFARISALFSAAPAACHSG